MKLTIIRGDNMVYIEGEPLIVDCSSLDSSIHAVQWNGTNGIIEFVDPDPFDNEAPAPQRITDISQFQSLIDSWNAAKQAQILEAQRLAELEAERLAQANT